MAFGPPFAAGMLSSSAMKYVSIYLEDYLKNVKRWSGSGRDTANIVIADDAECGPHFTEKNLSDLQNLRFYELQHALYAAWRAFDHTYGDTKNADRSRVLSNYAEYRRRGITHFKDPLI